MPNDPFSRRRSFCRRWKAAGFVLGIVFLVNAADRATPVTFTKDVAPILQEKCQNCHRAGQIAPMSLVSYEETRPWAKAIKERVVTRNMPPWHLDKTVGIQQFQNDFLALRCTDRDHRPLGGWRRSDGRPEGYAAAQTVAERRMAGGLPKSWAANRIWWSNPNLTPCPQRARTCGSGP